jgi:hypothetical protein
VEILTADEAEVLRRGSAPYGGSRYGYDFETELAKTRDRERVRERAKARLAQEPDRLFWLCEFPAPPTPEALRRQERFGKEGVQETADVYGVDLTARTEVRQPKKVRSQARRSRAMKNTMREVGA